eukprot:892849-Pleurochrysis_carterae.AAC.1
MVGCAAVHRRAAVRDVRDRRPPSARAGPARAGGRRAAQRSVIGDDVHSDKGSTARRGAGAAWPSERSRITGNSSTA